MNDTNKIDIQQLPYEVDGKILFTEVLKRVSDRWSEALEGLGDD